jgi:hypothetical protein
VALKKSADVHENEAKELTDLLNVVEEMFVKCMSCPQMSSQLNVLIAVSGVIRTYHIRLLCTH